MSPALLTSISRLPSAVTAVETICCHVASRETSPATATARPPSEISAATASAPAWFRSLTRTAAPSCASRSAIARPMPCPAPVTTATLSSSVTSQPPRHWMPSTSWRPAAEPAGAVDSLPGCDAALGGARSDHLVFGGVPAFDQRRRRVAIGQEVVARPVLLAGGLVAKDLEQREARRIRRLPIDLEPLAA